MKITGIDHFVLTVKDINESKNFYVDKLGMVFKQFGKNRSALHFGQQKINLHQMDKPIDENVLHATCGSSDFCLVVSEKIDEIIDDLESKGVHIISGPSVRTGAQGPINSVYIYDPDENLIEISTYKN